MNNEFKEVIYFPSFSAHAGYYTKNIQLTENTSFRFYQEDCMLEQFRKDFVHKYFLISAGIQYKKKNVREEMGLTKDCLVMGDSGGHQICTGTLTWSTDLRDDIFNWLENNSDVAINIDIPPRGMYQGKFEEALNFSYDNFKWFNEHQTGKTEFLSVIQGTEAEDYEVWYNKIKGMDFKGWSVGGGQQSMAKMLYAFAVILQGGELEKKSNKWLHFLGQTRPRDFFIYNLMQKWLEENGNKYTRIMTDSSTPVQFTLFGNAIYGIDYNNLSYKLLYFPQKEEYYKENKTPYPSYIETPISHDLRIEDLSPDTPQKRTKARQILGHQNLFVLLKCMKEIRSLSKLDLPFLEHYIVDKDFIKVLKSIKLMIENPEDALKIARKHKVLYDKFSNKEVPNEDLTLMDSLFE